MASPNQRSIVPSQHGTTEDRAPCGPRHAQGLAAGTVGAVCELIAAKVRTSNKKQRHLSTGEAIRLLEEVRPRDPGWLRPGAERPLDQDDREPVSAAVGLRPYQSPAATGRGPLQAEHSNECWQFDLSPSDLKAVKEPSWVRPRSAPPR